MTIDLKKDRRDRYQPPTGEFVEVVVPPTTYLAIDGHGDPNSSPAYASALEALYSAAYAVRFALKARTGQAWVVGPLEGLWSSADPATFAAGEKAAWDWTLLIALPEVVEAGDVDAGLAEAAPEKLRTVLRQPVREG